MSTWNYAAVWEAVAASGPDEVALVHGPRRVTWRSFDAEADRLARFLLDAGLGHQAKVAEYLVNCPEYLVVMFASFKASLVPVNTNYRYGADELTHLWTSADIDAVVFHGRFTATASQVRPRLGRVHTWIHVDDGTDPCPPWAVPYAQAVAQPASSPVRGPWGHRPDDLFLLYTGGTTGLPKGVMWRQDDVFARMNAGAMIRYPEEGDVRDIPPRLARGRGPVHVPASPLMHGTGAITTMSSLAQGGRVVTLTAPSFDAIELLDVIDAQRVQTMAIVGDMFARPLVAALDAEPDRWDITSLRQVLSSGVGWSMQTQQALLRHHPRLVIIDALGASEAIGIARAIRTGDAPGSPGCFEIPDTTRVIGPDDRDVVPGSGEIGRVAARGRVPLGYYGDPDASARVFPLIDGVRHAIAGDLATVEADGTVLLLGRGSQCINTGGEKVFAEEVEEVIKMHPDVVDAVVLGLPDPTWGEAVCALVVPRPSSALDAASVIALVKARLAGYKAPKRVILVDNIGRGANGKIDYPGLRAMALAAIEEGRA